MNKNKPGKDMPLEIVDLDPEGIANVLNGAVEILHDASGTANFLHRGLKSFKDKGVKFVIPGSSKSNPDLEREFDNVMEILILMRDKIPERLFTLVAINQKEGDVPAGGGPGKSN